MKGACILHLQSAADCGRYYRPMFYQYKHSTKTVHIKTYYILAQMRPRASFSNRISNLPRKLKVSQLYLEDISAAIMVVAELSVLAIMTADESIARTTAGYNHCYYLVEKRRNSYGR